MPAPRPTSSRGLAQPWSSPREDLDPRPRECLVCYVDRLLARGDCAGSLDLTRWWGELRAPRATTLVARLGALGASCDCGLLTTAYEPTPSLVPRTAGPWDRPRCLGVHPGSTRPCGRWRLRPRWA